MSSLVPLLLLLLSLAAASLAMPLRDPASNSTRPKIGAEGVYGFDISSPVSVSDFQCLAKNGMEFAVIRAFQSIGIVDPNAAQNIRNAKDGGIKYVDVYLFPCPKCSASASEQVRKMVDSVSGFGQIWLDIEGAQYWLGSYSDNQKFFEELLSAASSHYTTGVYASEYEWSSIMGSSYTGGSGHQLWYAHYDDRASFSDFVSFGGWRSPAIKQYEGDASVCGVDIDRDWY